MDSEGACLIWSGRAFQSLGLAMEKALSPLSFCLDLGTSRSSWSAELRQAGVMLLCDPIHENIVHEDLDAFQPLQSLQKLPLKDLWCIPNSNSLKLKRMVL